MFALIAKRGKGRLRRRGRREGSYFVRNAPSSGGRNSRAIRTKEVKEGKRRRVIVLPLCATKKEERLLYSEKKRTGDLREEGERGR